MQHGGSGGEEAELARGFKNPPRSPRDRSGWCRRCIPKPPVAPWRPFTCPRPAIGPSRLCEACGLTPGSATKWSRSSPGRPVLSLTWDRSRTSASSNSIRLAFRPRRLVTSPSVSSDTAAGVAAAAAYFLATLPNAGAEALLSHLTVGAHARLAEDGRKAVAQMGNQQRASADVLIMFGQAIEREQRRMRSFGRYMPAPLDPMLRNRIADMEKGITSVWTSIGITSSPFVPAAERIRGRGGEDRRVRHERPTAALTAVEPPTALLRFPKARRTSSTSSATSSTASDRSATFATRCRRIRRQSPCPSVVDYFERLAKAGSVTLR